LLSDANSSSSHSSPSCHTATRRGLKQQFPMRVPHPPQNDDDEPCLTAGTWRRTACRRLAATRSPGPPSFPSPILPPCLRESSPVQPHRNAATVAAAAQHICIKATAAA
jgi:hypothetical protein